MTGDRVKDLVFIIELKLFKCTTGGCGFTRDHKSKLIGDIKKSTTVVAQIEHQVSDASGI